jgi:hypothetical protein
MKANNITPKHRRNVFIYGTNGKQNQTIGRRK